MDGEFAREIAVEQRENLDQPVVMPPAESQPLQPMEAPDRARPRGRPFVKGQSGNPAGRPRRIHPPAAVAEYIIGRKTIPLAKKVRDMALAGDRSMLRLWYQNVAPARRGAADWAGLPLVEDRAELRGNASGAAVRG